MQYLSWQTKFYKNAPSVRQHGQGVQKTTTQDGLCIVIISQAAYKRKGGTIMARERMSEASWNAKTKRWCCRVMVRGKRRAFYSSIEGRRGKREAERKADQWIETGAISPKTKVCNPLSPTLKKCLDSGTNRNNLKGTKPKNMPNKKRMPTAPSFFILVARVCASENHIPSGTQSAELPDARQ